MSRERSQPDPEPHVILHAPPGAIADDTRQGLLAAGARVSCTQRDEELLEALVREHATALVLALRSELASDVALLTLVRRVSPSVPLVLLGHADSVGDRQVLQRFQPHFYALEPCDPVELVEAVLGSRRRRRSADR